MFRNSAYFRRFMGATYTTRDGTKVAHAWRFISPDFRCRIATCKAEHDCAQEHGRNFRALVRRAAHRCYCARRLLPPGWWHACHPTAKHLNQEVASEDYDATSAYVFDGRASALSNTYNFEYMPVTGETLGWAQAQLDAEQQHCNLLWFYPSEFPGWKLRCLKRAQG